MQAGGHWNDYLVRAFYLVVFVFWVGDVECLVCAACIGLGLVDAVTDRPEILVVLMQGSVPHEPMLLALAVELHDKRIVLDA